MTKQKETQEHLKKEENLENQTQEAKIEESKKSPVRRITIIVFSICILFFFWYVAANRHTPYTSQARLNALVVPIVPYVSGYLKKTNVRLHSHVKKGDTLFQIDIIPFKVAVQSAEASVDKATQRMGFQGASVKSAVGRLRMARAQLNYYRVIQV